MLLPSIVESQIRQGLSDYLRTTFPITTPDFSGMLDGLIEDENGIFKGPYVSLALPFKKGTSGTDYFPKVPLPFPPYRHQELAFRRLSEQSSKSTIVATGTGSGKTESFLWPILAYCADRAPSQGIKAILIYPMNALATDQARRIAKTIWVNPNLKGKVTAGLYVGGEEKNATANMGRDTVITDKETLRESPPDILLTNYKMLDYLLQRPKDKALWSTTSAATFRYLVVDELHTFDGAQGTDLACLIRRLKYRIGLSKGQLCCVGTSATLGSGEENRSRLLDYAQRIFGETFDNDSVVTEMRQDTREFLSGSFVRFEPMPDIEQTTLLKGKGLAGTPEYLTSQINCWFKDEITPSPFDSNEWRVKLGELLKTLPLFRSVLEVLDGNICPVERIIEELGSVYWEFGGVQTENAHEHKQYRTALLLSLFAMISAARKKEGDTILPFVQVRVQLWMRELRRMVADVSSAPRMRFADDLTPAEQENHLPVVHCRECGAVGWVGIRRKNKPESVKADLKEFYTKFFANKVSTDVTFLFPGTTEDFSEGNERGRFYHLCTNCLELNVKEGKCDECGSQTIRVFVPVNTRTVKSESSTFYVGTKDCPACGTKSSLMLIGAQSASIASVAISQLFASKFNGDKKLLTFSDNVQDAAHRVGFFSARTWRFNLRAAIRQYLSICKSQMQLDIFIDGFVEHWRKELGDSQFVATFIPRDMMWMEAFERLIERNDELLLPDIVDKITKRIGWEIYAEFGFDCRRGRTLEKSGAATLMPVIDFPSAADNLFNKLTNEFERFRGELTSDNVSRFLYGIIEHARQNGAVFYPIMESYISSGGNSYLLSRIPWMPKYGPGMKLPGFFSEQKNSHSRSQFESWSDPTDWIYRWTIKLFEQYDPLIEHSVIDILQQTFNILKTEGLFYTEDIDNNRIWGMLLSQCKVTPEVVQLRCTHCGHQISIAAANEFHSAELPCFKIGCRGVYNRTDARKDYYDELYRYGDILRLYAEEHTGLLSREKRELVEQKFKAPDSDRKMWYPNLLSCTPTLELGIDIGDLSSVLLCSVPPAQASYLQRIGRAGRTDGNALTMTIACGKPHDLYFYEEPLEMMAGAVATPGVHLGAVAVLERQFTAFCLDCWVHEHDAIDIPKKMFEVFSRVEKNKAGLFPLSFYVYVQKNQKRLHAEFCALFNEYLTDDTRELLASYIGGGEDIQLTVKIDKEINELLKNRDSLKKKLEIVRRKLDKIKKDPVSSEEEKDSLAKESTALGGLIRSINDKDTLNFFTDSGLIPNYAFPEAGVTLHSVIYRKKEKSGTGGYDTKEYEYQRSASSAISELVPGNVFYANGRHVTIDQVDMTLSQPEDWRFCPNCNHMELVISEEPKKECPQCSAQGWFDTSQVKPLLKVRQVFANTSERDSLTRDDDDEREKHFYVHQLFVDFKQDDVEGAWSIENEDITFGFEFIRKTTFREINFGEQTAEPVEGITVAGKEYNAAGFIICRHCGTVQKKHSEKSSHANFCPVKDKEKENNFEHVLYLYREFQSESIRFLIPAVTEGADRKMQSFLAALMMGLREQYKGDIDHLATSIYDEPVPNFPQQNKRYVVLYDTVPGGTGYLKQITKDKELIFGILEKALRRMQSCSCQNNKDKDGCYRCLLVYRNSRLMNLISRETAEELLTSILRNREKIEKVHSLSGITMNRILESELEKKFIISLNDKVKKEGGRFELEMRGNKPCYRLEFPGDGKKWFIEPQCEIKSVNKKENICRADFVFYPNGFDGKRIVVFTDGLFFHKDRIGLDMRQRMELLHHPDKFLTWSLTWKDIEQFQSGSAYDQEYNLLKLTGNQQQLCHEYCKKILATSESSAVDKKAVTCSTIAPSDKSSMYWFFEYLKNPNTEMWIYNALARTLALMVKDDRTEPQRTERLSLIKSSFPENISNEIEISPATIPLRSTLGLMTKDHFIQTNNIMAAKWTQSLDTILYLDDSSCDSPDFERIWNEYLRLVNIYQFLPSSLFFTKCDLAAEKFHEFNFNSLKTSVNIKYKTVRTQEWDDVYSMVSTDSVHSILDTLCDAGLSIPVVGYELVDNNNRVCGMAELAWEEMKIAYLLIEEYKGSFSASGWNVFVRGEEKLLLENVKEAKNA